MPSLRVVILHIKSHDIEITEIFFLSHNRRSDVDWVNSASNKVRSLRKIMIICFIFDWFMRLTIFERLETRVDGLH
jgi:hypothetical protein